MFLELYKEEPFSETEFISQEKTKSKKENKYV